MPGPIEPTPPDHYEHGLEEIQRRRQAMSSSGLPPDATPMAEKRPPRISWKWLLGALAVVLIIAIVRGGGGRPPALEANCSRPAFVLSTHSVAEKSNTVVRWSATGPATARFFLAIGADHIEVSPQRVTAVAPSGRHSQVASKLQTFGKSCLRHGEFGVLIPAGDYPVGLYRLDASRATLLAWTTLRVRPS